MKLARVCVIFDVLTTMNTGEVTYHLYEILGRAAASHFAEP